MSDDPHKLQFREDEITSENTRYDNIVSGGSDHERFIQWITYSVISLSVSVFVLLVFLSILSKKEVRQRAFNLYLIFLIIPDLVFSFFCGINCALNAANGDYISAGWCRFQVIYCVWGIGSNAWLNAAIARHVHNMLEAGNNMIRYSPPTIKQVVLESVAVYLWLAFLSSWPFLDFLPHRARLSAGLACLPHEYDTASTIFFWVVFMPCFVFIPSAYAIYVAFDVWRRQLLPPEGRKKRNIAIYFFRLTVVFLIMWVPSVFLIFIAGGFTSSWVVFIGGSWSHLQGAVSAVASIMKQDIGEAFVEFMTCRGRTLQHQRAEEAPSTSSQLVGWRSFLVSSGASVGRPPAGTQTVNAGDDVETGETGRDRIYLTTTAVTNAC